MDTPTLYRISGACLAISATTLAAVTWAERFTGPDIDRVPPLVEPAAVPVHVVSFLAFLLFAPGLVGLYLAHRDRLAALLGCAAVGIGFSLGVLPHTVLDFSAIPVVVDALPEPDSTALVDRMYGIVGVLASVGGLLGVAGIVTLGVVLLRAGRLPRWAGIAGLAAVPAAVLLGVVGGVLPGVPMPHAPVALDLGLAAYGLALAGRRTADERVPTPVG